MKLEAKYFYENGQEMKEGDLVYLKGRECFKGYEGYEFSGIFTLAHINEDLLKVYFLGQDKKEQQIIEIDVDTMSALIPLTNYGLIEEVEEMQKEISDKIKNRR